MPLDYDNFFKKEKIDYIDKLDLKDKEPGDVLLYVKKNYIIT